LSVGSVTHEESDAGKKDGERKGQGAEKKDEREGKAITIIVLLLLLSLSLLYSLA
jgi:hypothetical protein